MQEEVLGADQAVALTEHEREPERPEQQSAQERVDDASVRTFTVSRERANPASSAMNPACMKKTRNAVTRTQTVLTGFTRSFA